MLVQQRRSEVAVYDADVTVHLLIKSGSRPGADCRATRASAHTGEHNRPRSASLAKKEEPVYEVQQLLTGCRVRDEGWRNTFGRQ
jgi:hypothetical protein